MVPTTVKKMGVREMMNKRLLLLSVWGLTIALASSSCSAQAGGSQTSQNESTLSQMAAQAASLSSSSVKKNVIDASSAINGARLAMAPRDIAKLKLAPGFLLGLNVLDDQDFSGSFRIDEGGNIVFPILGTMHLAGKTASEAQAEIRELLLRKEILNDPQVTLSVLEYVAPEVTIEGEVNSPGAYPLLAPRKLMDVLALAGGLSVTAGDEVQILHEGSETSVQLHYSKATDPKAVEQVMIHPGDTIRVRRAGIVYVLGAVNRPGGYVMQEDGRLNILQAITLANGFAVNAKDTLYLLRRRDDGNIERMTLSYKELRNGQGMSLQVLPKDVLYIPTSPLKSLFTINSSLLGAATSATIYGFEIR